MSVQAGLWFFDGRPIDEDFVHRVSATVAPYGPDRCKESFLGPVGLIFRAFCTTPESWLEDQPHMFGGGKVMMWDGRLDNRDELSVAIDGRLATRKTDLEIVAAAYERWGTDCLCKLVGDWALTMWDSQESTLILARDYAAVRHLYYYVAPGKIFWCTQLAPIVLLSGTKFTLNDEYVAGYIVTHPDAHLTPYREIHAVPPGAFVKVRNGKVAFYSYWTFEPKSFVRYRTDEEYEDHYRHLFRQAVRRRLRTDSPILAELSGGYDSSSIVCMADDILVREGAAASRLDTVSHFDLKEPQVDDHLYFTKVEERRGRSGFHIDAEASGLPFVLGHPQFSPTPRGQLTDHLKQARRKIVEEGGYRVTLSGLGGDEMNGQASDCRVLMGDLLAQFRFRELAFQLKAWSLLMKRPWIHLFGQVCLQLLPLPVRARLTRHTQMEPWIGAKFSRRYQLSERKLGRVQGARFWLPSARDWAVTLATLARQMGEDLPSFEEKRYPYLDRDLVDFLTAVPPDQLLRPGQRRSLMRRALANLLPREILARRTKAAAARCFVLLVEKYWNELQPIFEYPLAARLGYIHAANFRKALQELKSGIVPASIIDLMRGLTLEFWLRDATRNEVLAMPNTEVLPKRVGLAQSRAWQFRRSEDESLRSRSLLAE